MPPPAPSRPRLLITAGPTIEPIDAVRFIGNRSSGRLGIALARAANQREWPTRLLLGPFTQPEPEHIAATRFTTTEDLRDLLRTEAPAADIIIMAAAVADFRVRQVGAFSPHSKLRRGERLTLELESTPDLLAELAGRRQRGQVLVGFALQPRETMLDAAREKLQRKGVDLMVANPLETMDAPAIEAVVVGRSIERPTDGAIPKDQFAPWLLDIIEEHMRGT